MMAAPDGEDGPWWRMSEPEIQELVRNEIAKAIHVTLTVTDGKDARQTTVTIREPTELGRLSEEFEIVSSRAGCDVWMSDCFIEVEVAAGQTTRFILVGDHILYGPWASNAQKRAELERQWWYQVRIDRQFVRDLRKIAKAKPLG